MGVSIDKAHLIYCAPRTGSANLQLVLSRHPQIHNEGEVFNPAVLELYPESNPIRRLADPAPERFLDLLSYLGQTTGKTQVGVKLLYTCLSEAQRKDLLVSGLKVVHLYRSDLLAQSLSYLTALRSNVWHVTGETIEGRKRISIPAAEVMQNISYIENIFEETRKLLARSKVPNIEVEYTQLYDDPEIGLRRIQNFLEVEQVSLDPDFFRHKTRERFPHQEYIENYDELVRRFSQKSLV